MFPMIVASYVLGAVLAGWSYYGTFAWQTLRMQRPAVAWITLAIVALLWVPALFYSLTVRRL